MTGRAAGSTVVVMLLAAAGSCAPRAPKGGAAETQLAAATQAVDLARVKQALASGADPNKVVDVAGNPQSAWYLALYQVRASKPVTAEIALAMLGAGASPTSAWGTSAGRPREGFWEAFRSGHRLGGTNDESPLIIAMGNPVPAVVKAIIAAGYDGREGPRALVDAVESGEIEIVHMLVESGVNVNAESSGRSAFEAAIATRNAALVTYFEEHGATERGR